MKGISPLIAAVILIAIAVSVGMSLTTGMMQFVREGTGQTEFSCATSAYYTIEFVSFNKSGNGKLLVKVTNRGNFDLYGFGMILYSERGIKLLEAEEIEQAGISKESPLKRGRSVILSAEPGEFGNIIKEISVINEACETVSAKKLLSP